MLYSMTGFGRATVEKDGFRAQVEINTVNSRYCEVYLRTPRALNPHDPEIQKLVKDTLVRGKVNVSIQVQATDALATTPPVDTVAVKAYKQMIDTIRVAAGIDEPVGLEHVLKYADMYSASEDPERSASQQWAATLPAVKEALERVLAMREVEGSTLKTDLQERLILIELELEKVEDRSPERVEEARIRLRGRIQDALDDTRLDPARLETELVLLTDKLDVTEETVRLRSHIEQFQTALSQASSPGRKLNFLAQELNREINTIGAKANDAEITGYVVQMKEELERIREQVQNIV